jgi:hypothetical protein
MNTASAANTIDFFTTTSRSYSRYLRIATPLAIGIPSTSRTNVVRNRTLLTITSVPWPLSPGSVANPRRIETVVARPT